MSDIQNQDVDFSSDEAAIALLRKTFAALSDTTQEVLISIYEVKRKSGTDIKQSVYATFASFDNAVQHKK